MAALDMDRWRPAAKRLFRAVGNDGVDMARRKRTSSRIAGAREARAIAANLGREARSTRL